MPPKNTGMLTLNFLVAITLVPLGVELFGRTGEILVGAQAIALHPWLTYLFSYLPILALLFIYLRAMLRPLREFGFTVSKKWVWPSVGIGVVSAVVLFLMDGPQRLIEDFRIAADPSLAVAVGWLLMLMVLVPLVEETLFRGIIQTMFEKRVESEWTVHPAILIASGFEVLMHASVPLYFAAEGAALATLVATVPQLLYVLVFGAIGGYVYHRTGSLVGPLLIHAIGNAGELLLLWALV